MLQSTMKLVACFCCGEPDYISKSGMCETCSLGFDDMIELHSDRFLDDDLSNMNPILPDDRGLNELSRAELIEMYKQATEDKDTKTLEALEWELSRRT